MKYSTKDVWFRHSVIKEDGTKVWRSSSSTPLAARRHRPIPAIRLLLSLRHLYSSLRHNLSRSNAAL